jgi:hypothetical protein
MNIPVAPAGADSHRLTLDGRVLGEALRLLDDAADAALGPQVTLRYEDGELIVEFGGAAVAIPADGSWPDAVNADARSLEALRADARDGIRTLALSANGALRLDSVEIAAGVPSTRPLATPHARKHALRDRLPAARARLEGIGRSARGSLPDAAALRTAVTRFGGAARAALSDERHAIVAFLRRRGGWLLGGIATLALLYLGATRLSLPGPVHDVLARAGMPLAEPRAVTLGRDAYLAGDTDAALASLTDAASRYRSSPAALLELALIYQDLGDAGTAALLLEEAVARDAGDRDVALELAALLARRGIRHERAGEADRAAEAFQHAAAVLAPLSDGDPLVAAWRACVLARVPGADAEPSPTPTWAECRPNASS